jgi:serine/threonine protein kinase
MEEKEAAIMQYRGISEKYISKKIFDNNRKNIEGLIVNNLMLLYHLRNQHIAIRDLKPDNIFIAGNFDGADNFLNNPKAFSFGLIDLETAVHLHPDEPAKMRQPLLAGTFPFMTPHHLFRNSDLYRLFGKETSRVLYMQDWFAAIGMIFNVATGKTLFIKTAKLMHKVFEIKKKAVKDTKSLTDTLKSVSWIFWNTAAIECQRKIKIHSDKFGELDIKLPEPVIEMLKDELSNEKAVIKKAIRERINSKTYLKKHGQQIYKASSGQTAGYRKKWEDNTYKPQVPAASREKIINILRGMESLKKQIERHDSLSCRLENKIPCDELIMILFSRVLNAMYRQFWTHREYPLKDDV